MRRFLPIVGSFSKKHGACIPRFAPSLLSCFTKAACVRGQGWNSKRYNQAAELMGLALDFSRLFTKAIRVLVPKRLIKSASLSRRFLALTRRGLIVMAPKQQLGWTIF